MGRLPTTRRLRDEGGDGVRGEEWGGDRGEVQTTKKRKHGGRTEAEAIGRPAGISSQTMACGAALGAARTRSTAEIQAPHAISRRLCFRPLTSFVRPVKGGRATGLQRDPLRAFSVPSCLRCLNFFVISAHSSAPTPHPTPASYTSGHKPLPPSSRRARAFQQRAPFQVGESLDRVADRRPGD